CAAGSDLDCCENAGKVWYENYGCYDQVSTPPASCETSGDGICPGNCAAGSDYDCCQNKGYCWTSNGCNNC
ncbi:MAG TPA: hypothetical protein VJJ21_04800, partial [Candidatus Nanoarchaeia archaeon]|nr:hypothetical protein [Candidatus Nanoarchaeia archaeon]